MKKGDVVLVRFPFTDFESEKLRPAVVLVPENSYGDVCVAFVTSRTTTGDDCILIAAERKDFKQTGLKVSSTIRVRKIVTIQRSLVVSSLGRLSARHLVLMNTVLKKIFKL